MIMVEYLIVEIWYMKNTWYNTINVLTERIR